MRARFINEKFKEESDPVRDLNVGLLDRTKQKYKGYILELDFDDYIVEKISNAFGVDSADDLFYLADNTADETDYDVQYSDYNEYDAFRRLENIIKTGEIKKIFKESFNTGRSNTFYTTITVYETPIGKIASITYEHGNYKQYFGDVSAFLNIVEV